MLKNLRLFFLPLLLWSFSALASDQICSPLLHGWQVVLQQLTVESAETAGTVLPGSGIKVVMASIELGKVEGLTNRDGTQVDIAAGGVSAVMNDISKYYPRFLADQKQGSIVKVGLLMDQISTEQMSFLKTLKVPVEGHTWDVGLYEYYTPSGVKYLFLDNPSFKRMTAKPDKSVIGQSVYTMRGLEAGTREDRLEEQRIWAAINQSIAQVFTLENGQIYLPHDYHVSPASFYISRRMGETPLASKPLVHNEAYMGIYDTSQGQYDQVGRIWSISSDEMNEYFMQGDQFVMIAPAVRLAEQNEVFSALSVSAGTANALNGTGGRNKLHTFIDFFERVGDLTNGFAEENRPHLNDLLRGKASEAEIRADGIVDLDTIRRFQRQGYRFGYRTQSDAEMLGVMADAKAALQRNFRMTIDPKKPLFVSFARMVHQKGLEFVAQNIEHILNQGGQVIVGGPVGDAVGAKERELFLAIQRRLKEKNHPHAHDFVFIDGAVKGRLKGLVLAGGDFFLIPSRFEPCGLTDCEALYHGTIPIAHRVGGLDKGKATILYDAPHPDDQGLSLGQAILEALALYAQPREFDQLRLEAMREDFSMEGNFSRFLQNYRIEVYGKILRELAQAIQSGQMSESEAKAWFTKNIARAHAEDMKALANALKQMHPSRRANWPLTLSPSH